MLNFKRLFIAFLFYFCCIFSAHANEYIELFKSDITVNQDGSLLITETLRVHHEGKEIKRGIYRDLSTTKGEHYKILGVMRNDFPEPWFTEKKDTALRLNTGDNEYLPTPATSTFELTYIMYDALRPIRGENLNELYLNVTGKWVFPIKTVEINVYYPENTEVVRQYSYRTNQPAQKLEPNSTFIEHSLAPNHEITIAQAFTQGTINIPFPKIYKTLLFALLITLIYYLIMWAIFGKDPPAQPIVPDWEPPHDLTPLECKVLDKQGTAPDNAFFIHIIWLLSQKIITMKTQKYSGLFGSKEIYELTTQSNIAENKKSDEVNLYLSNFPSLLRLTSQQSENITCYQFNLIKKALKRLNKKYYNYHTWATFFGALIFPTCWAILFPESINLSFLIFMLGAGIPSMMQRHIIIVIIFIAIWLPAINMATFSNPQFSAICAIYAIIVYLFNYLMFEPTFIGQRQIEKIEGLKMFLKAITSNKNIAQEDKRLTPKDMEQLFPYAVALDLEKAWSKKYEAIFGAPNLQKNDAFNVYHNSNLCSNLSNYCSSATSYSSSGNGSSGGGSSGGGCGGGGGGGR